MLVHLQVSNFVLLQHLVLELGPGFHVLTGGTGYGKSMVVDALQLVLGGRSRPEMIRTGAQEAVVEARFQLPSAARLVHMLEEEGVSCTEGLSIRRVVPRTGRSRAYLNGQQVPVSRIADVAATLCDITSQHESLRLTDPGVQLDCLDAFGQLLAERDTFAEAFDTMISLKEAYAHAKRVAQEDATRAVSVASELDALALLDPQQGEEQALEQERSRLRHAEKLGQAVRYAVGSLSEGEHPLCDELARIARGLRMAALLDPTLESTGQAVDNAHTELTEVAQTLALYAERLTSHPDRLEEVEDRLFRLQKLLRQHGPTTVELLAYRDALVQEQQERTTCAGRMEALQAAYATKLLEVGQAAQTLSDKRKAVAFTLAQAVEEGLATLGMSRARLQVEIQPLPPREGELDEMERRCTRTGSDRVEFLIAPNRGEAPRPLRHMASGGELSRTLLAMKRVLSAQNPVGLSVFDEVDTGVSGAVAEAMGLMMAELAQNRQVLCITHLPQIAALADVHWTVDKTEGEEHTVSTLRPLSGEERVAHLAQMIGGARTGEAAYQAARELLKTRLLANGFRTA